MISGDQLWGNIGTNLINIEAYDRKMRTWSDIPKSISSMLTATACRFPSKTAINEENRGEWTYSQLNAAVERLSTYLRKKCRVNPTDRVALLAENSIEFVVAFIAINRVGAIVVPLPGKYRQAELLSLVRRARIKSVIAEQEFEKYLTQSDLTSLSFIQITRDEENPTVIGLPPYDSNEDPHSTHLSSKDSHSSFSASLESDAILMYTSGTTAQSKGVIMTNLSIAHAVVSYQRTLNLSNRDTTIVATPLYHVTGLVAILAVSLYVGITVHVQRRFQSRAFCRLISDKGISFVHASPTVFTLMLNERKHFRNLPSVRILACGAAHMPVTSIIKLHQWMPHMQFRTIYGLTETTSPGCIFPCDAATSPHIGASGIPIPGLDLEIRTEDNQEAPRGTPGTIWMRGTNIARCYDNVKTQSLTGEGWLNTGDVGYINEENYLFIVGRTKEMINRGGEKVWCIDVEENLRTIPGIADAAVAGISDQIYGEVPVAAIVSDGTAKPSFTTITAHLVTKLAKYELPTRFLWVATIPLTRGSKVDRKAVASLFDRPVQQ